MCALCLSVNVTLKKCHKTNGTKYKFADKNTRRLLTLLIQLADWLCVYSISFSIRHITILRLNFVVFHIVRCCSFFLFFIHMYYFCWFFLLLLFLCSRCVIEILYNRRNRPHTNTCKNAHITWQKNLSSYVHRVNAIAFDFKYFGFAFFYGSSLSFLYWTFTHRANVCVYTHHLNCTVYSVCVCVLTSRELNI